MHGSRSTHPQTLPSLKVSHAPKPQTFGEWIKPLKKEMLQNIPTTNCGSILMPNDTYILSVFSIGVSTQC